MANKELVEKFHLITKMKYRDQAVWFLNGFWKSGADKEAETVWTIWNKFIETDTKNKKNGNELDEFQAHVFLESMGETLTVVEMRDRLRQIDLDFNKKVALIEYLTVKYKKPLRDVAEASQGENVDEINAAAAKLQAVQDAFIEVQTQLESQQKALESQRKAEESLHKSEAELKVAIDETKKQEDSYYGQIKTLEGKINDTNASTVTKSKASNELAQLKSEDPLPLRKAKVTQEAALRKVEKEKKILAEAIALTEAKKASLEKAVADAEKKVKEAAEYLEFVKRKGGSGQGAIWWLERELKDAQKYLPKSKQTKI